jgi:hypothetical protein
LEYQRRLPPEELLLFLRLPPEAALSGKSVP